MRNERLPNTNSQKLGDKKMTDLEADLLGLHDYLTEGAEEAPCDETRAWFIRCAKWAKQEAQKHAG